MRRIDTRSQKILLTTLVSLRRPRKSVPSPRQSKMIRKGVPPNPIRFDRGLIAGAVFRGIRDLAAQSGG